MLQKLTTSLTIDWGLLLRLRSLGFACGLATSFVFPLALSLLLSPSEADCFAHWSYPIGELIALLASLAIWYRQHPSTLLAHALFTAVWAVFVGANCHLWVALWTGAPVAHHTM